MVRGTVACFDHEYGYGFLTVPGSYEHVFVHATAVAAPGVDSLREGQHVTFDLIRDLQAPRAANVMPENEPAPATPLGHAGHHTERCPRSDTPTPAH